MKHTASRKAKQAETWPRKIRVGRVTVSVYRRLSPLGHPCFMVANYAGDKRRFDSYGDETAALDAAARLARQLSERDTQAAKLTEPQALEYAAACQSLKPLGLTLPAAVAALIEAVKLTGDLPGVAAAARFYKAKHKTVTPKRVADVVSELLALKKTRGASERYLGDLKFRLEKFADKFQCNIGSVQTSDIQTWLDSQKLSTQSYANNRRVVHLLFEFALARSYCLDNPAAKVERPKIRNGECEVFTPGEADKLLASAPDDFLPCLALGMFAGLRSAELTRLEWRDIDLKQGHIIVGADKAKTASRRIVPVAENLAVWLAPLAERQGRVWPQSGILFHKREQATAKAAGVRWKRNGMRHSFASYSFALSNDAARIAGYCGNSAAVIHRHYRQLVTPADAMKFFGIKPPAKAIAAPATANR